MTTLADLQNEATLHHLCETAALRAALRAKLAPQEGRKEHAGDLVLAEGETLAFEAREVHVTGNLVLADQARLYVAGNLKVDGNVVAVNFDYTLLFVGGTLEAKNLLGSGELVALGGIQVQGVAWTFYNDYSTYTDVLRARTVVQDDRSEFVGEVHAEQPVDSHPARLNDSLRPLLRPEVLEEDGSWEVRALAKRLLAGEELLAAG